MSKGKKFAFLVALVAVSALAVAGWAYESGSVHVNKNTSASISPNNVRNANDHGCNDTWADFHYVPENKLGSLGVWATDSNNQAHIDRHSGLDGWYECNGGLCNVHLCTVDGWYPFGGWNWDGNAWSVRLRIP